MNMTGEQRIAAPRQRVWEALNDPDILRASIPGCQSLDKEGDGSLRRDGGGEGRPDRRALQGRFL
jgi:carbon monoxide dehydrogenase subunit G